MYLESVGDGLVGHLHGIIEVILQLSYFSPNIINLTVGPLSQVDGSQFPEQLLLLLDQQQAVVVGFKLTRRDPLLQSCQLLLDLL